MPLESWPIIEELTSFCCQMWFFFLSENGFPILLVTIWPSEHLIESVITQHGPTKLKFEPKKTWPPNFLLSLQTPPSTPVCEILIPSTSCLQIWNHFRNRLWKPTLSSTMILWTTLMPNLLPPTTRNGRWGWWLHSFKSQRTEQRRQPAASAA